VIDDLESKFWNEFLETLTAAETAAKAIPPEQRASHMAEGVREIEKLRPQIARIRADMESWRATPCRKMKNDGAKKHSHTESECDNPLGPQSGLHNPSK
jgi:hypothetical protein